MAGSDTSRDEAVFPSSTAEFELEYQKGRNLRAEAQRLRLEWLNIGLDLGYSLATFGSDTPQAERARRSTREIAFRVYTDTRIFVSQEAQTGACVQGLLNKLERLYSALINEQADESANPKAHHKKQLHPDELTTRETEVLKRVAAGQSTKEIAGQLGITSKTVACHRYRGMEKLGIHDTAALVLHAIRTGMIKA